MELENRRRTRKTAGPAIPAEEIRAECFVLADGAQVSNGKVYVLGAGWNQLDLAAFPGTYPLVALVGILSVPWAETNQEHRFVITLQNEDNEPMLPQPVTGAFTLGRPPLASPGDPQNVPFTFNLNNLLIPRAGRYTAVLTVDDRELAKTSFRARRRG